MSHDPTKSTSRPAALSRDEQWEKLRKWLGENIEAIRRGDLERLPDSFTGERGEAAIEAYETCLEAMRFVEQWDTYGL